ncbi:hypothetical protein [Hyphococcus sp.]|uniref:hypothetical protein n=1 Tax=Hyphococcus sp. TaxID=2038636 RepID=UPI003CCC21A5
MNTLRFQKIIIAVLAYCCLSACAEEIDVLGSEDKRNNPSLTTAPPCENGHVVTYSFQGKGHSLDILPPEAVAPVFKPNLYKELLAQVEKKGLLPGDEKLSDFAIFAANSEHLSVIILINNKLPCPQSGCRTLLYSLQAGTTNFIPLAMGDAGVTNYYSWSVPRVLFNACGVQTFYYLETNNAPIASPYEDDDETITIWSLPSAKIE